MNKLTYGSLFAGVGGADIGFDNAGWECKFQVEWDKHCQSVLKKQWPNVPKFEDVRDVDGSALTPVEMVIFGSPCQDLSVAGKRSGLEGNRSGLFFEAIRIIKEMRNATNNQYPKYAIWENVPGALTSNKGEDFGEVLNKMADIGALGIEWHVLDAQWFGVAQRRRRVFVVACFCPTAIERSGGQILSVPQDSAGDIKKGRKERKQTSRASERSSSEKIWYGQSGFTKWTEGGVTLAASDHKRPERNFILEPFVKSRRAQSNVDDETWINNAPSPTLNAFDNSGESRSTVLIVDGTRVNDIRIYDDGIVPTLKHRMGTGGGQVPLVGETAIPIQGTIIGRADTSGPQGKGFGEEGDPSYTLDTISQHGVMTPELILRRLTPLECERLMGFPDDHTKYSNEGKLIADTNRYKMCGNAIASPVTEWIGKEIAKWI